MVNTKAHFNYDVSKYTDVFTSTMKMSLGAGVAVGVGDGVCANTVADKARVTMQPKIKAEGSA